MDTQTNAVESGTQDDALAQLVTVAGALLDTDRLRIIAALLDGPANRLKLAEATGLSQKDLVRHLSALQGIDMVRLQAPAPRDPDAYSPYEVNLETLRSARQALGKYKGVKPRPRDARLMTLETFMPGGKLTALPRKQDQLITILEELAQKFEPEKQYSERDVNVILEEVNEDYCTLRRELVDFGYLTRSGGVYKRTTDD